MQESFEFTRKLMKHWPQKRWKRALFVLFLAVIIIVVIIASAGLYVNSAVNKPVVSGIDVVNSNGNTTALVVYQAGLTAFEKDTSYAFANGLASNGWRVEITSASSQAPSNLSKYSLLVLVFPIYGGTPGKVIVDYLNDTGNLRGTNTVIIALGGMNSLGTSADTMKQKIQAANGTVLTSLYFNAPITLLGFAPGQGSGSPADLARQASARISPHD
jgi:flavorubredoxin